MVKKLCRACNKEPVHIQKRGLCRQCYQKAYKSIKKERMTWPLEKDEIAEDVRTEIKKRPEYKKYIKQQADRVINGLT